MENSGVADAADFETNWVWVVLPVTGGSVPTSLQTGRSDSATGTLGARVRLSSHFHCRC